MNHKLKFAERTKKMKAIQVRDSLSTFGIDNLISLAAGHPAQETLDYETFAEKVKEVVDEGSKHIMNYSYSNGLPNLREAVSYYLKRQENMDVDPKQIGISNGSQIAIDAILKVYLNKGDRVLVEENTFLAALQSLNSYEVEIIPVPLDENGIIVTEYEKLLKEHNPKLSYLIPKFSNPTGFTLSLERRKQLARIIKENDHIVIEDDPYSHIYFTDVSLPSLYSLAPENVIYCGSFSKSVAPGLRVAFYLGNFDVVDLINATRFSMDVHSNVLAQEVVSRIIKTEKFYENLEEMRKIYKHRKELMIKELERLPEGFSASNPEGGMFIWVQGPEDFDSEIAYKKALENGVSFVPGTLFSPDPEDGKNKLRLNFSSPSLEDIPEAISRLVKSLKL